MEQYLKEVGERVRKARKNKNLSQSQLAEMINASTPYISNIETGKHIMKITVLYKLVDALDVSADWLLKCKSAKAMEYTAEDFHRIAEDFSPAEVQGIIHVLEAARRSIRNIQDTDSRNT